MSHKRLFNNPVILYQQCDSDMDIPERDIGLHTDAGGLICIEQEGRTVIVNPESVPELCRLLKHQQKRVQERVTET